MFEHQKIVLEGVSDDSYLFKKELLKSIHWLKKKDIAKFNEWVIETFAEKQPKVINDLILDRLESDDKISA